MTREQRYNAVMDAAVRCHDQLDQSAHEADIAASLHDALLALLSYAENHGEDPELVKAVEAVAGWCAIPVTERRMVAPGVRQRTKKNYQRMALDCARFTMVERIVEGGVSEYGEAVEQALQCLINANHPAGYSDSGAPLDHRGFREGVERWRREEKNYPHSSWTHPAFEEFPLPEPK